MHDLKISIITVAYNSESTITDTINSVLDQSYRNIEYIIIDGGSTDNTINIINSFDGKISKFVSESDDGIYDAMNKGVSLSTGDVVGILNSDDFFISNDIVAQIANAFDHSENVDMLLTAVDFVRPLHLSNPVRFYSPKFFRPWMLYIGLMPPHPGLFVKKSIYDRFGGYKTNYKICADFEMFVRLLLKNNCQYNKLNISSVRMRIGGISTSGFRSRLLSSSEMVAALKANQLFSNYLLVSFRFFIKLFQCIKQR